MVLEKLLSFLTGGAASTQTIQKIVPKTLLRQNTSPSRISRERLSFHELDASSDDDDDDDNDDKQFSSEPYIIRDDDKPHTPSRVSSPNNPLQPPSPPSPRRAASFYGSPPGPGVDQQPVMDDAPTASPPARRSSHRRQNTKSSLPPKHLKSKRLSLTFSSGRTRPREIFAIDLASAQLHFPQRYRAKLLPHQVEQELRFLHAVFESSSLGGLTCTYFHKLLAKMCHFPEFFSKTLFPRVLKIAKNMGAARRLAGCSVGSRGRPLLLVTERPFMMWWRDHLQQYTEETRFFNVIKSDTQRNFITATDLRPFLCQLVKCSRALDFLRETPVFQERYIDTVVARILYENDRRRNGRIYFAEFRKSGLVSIFKQIDHVQDINEITRYFSYKHFYVIYRKFHELDTDHDMLLSIGDLSRYGNNALSTRVLRRIFETLPGPIELDPSTLPSSKAPSPLILSLRAASSSSSKKSRSSMPLLPSPSGGSSKKNNPIKKLVRNWSSESDQTHSRSPSPSPRSRRSKSRKSKKSPSPSPNSSAESLEGVPPSIAKTDNHSTDSKTDVSKTNKRCKTLQRSKPSDLRKMMTTSAPAGSPLLRRQCTSSAARSRLTAKRMTYAQFVWFLLSEEDKSTEYGQRYWFNIADRDSDGLICAYDIEYFYEEQMQRQRNSPEPDIVPFRDLMQQTIDSSGGRITISFLDIKRSGQGEQFFNALFNVHKFIADENANPFEVRAQQSKGQSRWEVFAAEEYKIAALEEVMNTNVVTTTSPTKHKYYQVSPDAIDYSSDDSSSSYYSTTLSSDGEYSSDLSDDDESSFDAFSSTSTAGSDLSTDDDTSVSDDDLPATKYPQSLEELERLQDLDEGLSLPSEYTLSHEQLLFW
eukprot:CAMPEP_0201548184 /NCGR_PEP_ID=MMETSP0173_2-20130828/4718_1 /ASSEMBLY_ACC=CAM_ASM_000268 /TAXON_ID=218659 /ORGANISM="Vexillifera sp., Strain DIVA3 564/2" /LENGTH=872 /DNA_ID=CAMNT_0047957483 /DNA_START=14 /DNA_END=2629 /DNA_ORIENTATION=+